MSILPFTEANSKRVNSLFRQALRAAFDNSLKFDAYREKTVEIRKRFEANKNVSDLATLNEIIAKTERDLAYWKHPDPYITPQRPGGTKYQRNIPKPEGHLVPGDW